MKHAPCFDKSNIVSPIYCVMSRLEALANRCVFTRVGMSAASFKILAILSHAKTMTPSEIQEKIEITKSNLSQRLRSFESKGWVLRSRDTDGDRRSVSFTITQKGMEQLHTAEALMKKSGLSFEKDFSDKEINDHISFFTKLLSRIEERAMESVSEGEVSSSKVKVTRAHK